MTAARTILRALLAALLVATSLAMVPRAAQADVGGSIDVTITRISDPVLDLSDPERVVELSGTILNTSASRIKFVNVHFWRSLDPITTRQGLDAALGSGPMDPLGNRLFEEFNLDPVTGEEFMEPGGRADFTVRATLAQLALPADDAIYRLGVHIRGIPEGATETLTVGRGRILAVATAEPLEAATVVALTAAPTQLATGDFLDESLLEELSGPLTTLLEAAERPGATALLDPSLLAEARALGQEHTVGGSPTAGHELAAEWAQRAEALTRGDALRLPYANPDLAAAAASGRLEETMDWASSAIRSDPIRRLPLAADLGSGATEENTEQLADLDVEAVFAGNVESGGAGAGGVVPVAPIEQAGMGPGGRSSDAQQLGRRLAEEYLSETPRVYLLRSAQDAAALGPLTHNTLVPVPEGDGQVGFAPASSPRAPREVLAASLADVAARAGFIEDLTGDRDSDTTELIFAKASSQEFRDEAAAVAYVEAHPLATVDANQVTISAAGQFVMGSRTNEFPVTITNSLAFPVTVRLVFDSASPQRIQVPPTDYVTVEPGEHLTLNIEPEASSNSVVNVQASLETVGGDRFGIPATIEITATDLGRVGWIIIIVSGAVVLGGTFLRIRAVQRESAKETREPSQ